jgi:hypothetical protein
MARCPADAEQDIAATQVKLPASGDLAEHRRHIRDPARAPDPLDVIGVQPMASGASDLGGHGLLANRRSKK